MRLSQQQFGETEDGQKAYLFIIENTRGIKLSITNYGGIITSILMPDQSGFYADVVLGFPRLEDYISEQYLSTYPYFGAICGRYAGRIRNGRFSLNGTDHQLVQNCGPHHIHGGLHGFDRKLYEFEIFKSPLKAGVRFSYLSVDGEENYPGNLKVCITYSLNSEDELDIEYHAVTDKATPVNLTNHTYFNLSGGMTKVLDHELQLESDAYTENDDMSVPFGNFKSVAGTPLDFRETRLLGKGIAKLEEGYDHNFIIRGNAGFLRKAAMLSEKVSGRRVEVFTTQPGLQVYSGYFLPKLSEKFGPYSGIALETQHFPDSPNQQGFPDTILYPGEVFLESTRFKFSL